VIGLHARRTSDVAARYGGEEFALLAPGTDLNHALRLAQTICDAVLQQDMAHQKSDFGKVSVSVGVASLVPGEADSPEQLVRLADQALYRAKQQGRNRVCQ
jgi:diguanylate cyclase (GGDEF)-like protein